MALTAEQIESLIRVCAEEGVHEASVGDLKLIFGPKKPKIRRKLDPEASAFAEPAGDGATFRDTEALERARQAGDALGEWFRSPPPGDA